MLLIYSEGYLDSFFFSTSTMLFQKYLFYESFSLLKLFPSWCSIYITCYSVLGKGLCLNANGMTQCSAPPDRTSHPVYFCPCDCLSLHWKKHCQYDFLSVRIVPGATLSLGWDFVIHSRWEPGSDPREILS